MPHTDTTFYKMAVGWTEDPKVVAQARFGPANAIFARDLFSQMIGYSRRNLTDGWVPAEELGRLMYPLPVDDAERLAAHLADRGAYGPLCSPHALSNGQGMPAASLEDANGMLSASSGDAAGIRGYQVLNYAKWNDTRADVQVRTERSRKAALRRWDQPGAPSIRGASEPHQKAMPTDAEQEQERDSPLPPAREHAARTGQGWTPSRVLDRPPRRGGPRTTHDNVAQVQAEAHRPGGPTGDVHGWAAKARAGITSPEDPATGPAQDPLPEHDPPEPAPQQPPPPEPDPEPVTAPEEPAEDEIPF